MLQKRGQYMDEKTIQRIKKLQALAERGVGGHEIKKFTIAESRRGSNQSGYVG